MNNIGNIAVTGMNAAATRLAVSASNMVNARTTAPATPSGEILGAAYEPKAVVQVSLTTGGVRTEVVPVEPAHRISADPLSPTGLSAYPNVGIINEIVNQAIAATSYKAAAQLLVVEQQMTDSLLDITG